MKRTRHTPEQIVRKLREADKLLAEGMPIAEVVRHLGSTSFPPELSTLAHAVWPSSTR